MVRKAAAPAAKERPIGDDIDALWNIRDQRRKLDAESKKLKAQEDEMELALIARLKPMKVDGIRGKLASVSMTEVKVPKIDPEQWTEFMQWMAKTKNYHFVQKRISEPALREAMDLKLKVPGLQTFDVTKLSLLTVAPK